MMAFVLLFLMAGMYPAKSADAQVVVRVGPRHYRHYHHRYYHHHRHYRHYHRY